MGDTVPSESPPWYPEVSLSEHGSPGAYRSLE